MIKQIFTILIAGSLIICSCSKSNVNELSQGLTERAGELGSGGTGGGGGGSTTCSPISSFTVKGDYRAGETGISTIDISYAVKPCISGQTLTVSAEIIDFRTGAVLQHDDNLQLSGKYHFQSCCLYGLYTAKLIVLNATAGSVEASTQTTVALVSKKV